MENNKKPNNIIPFREKLGICQLCKHDNYSKEIVADKLCINCIKYITRKREIEKFAYHEIFENKSNLLSTSKMLVVDNYTMGVVYSNHFINKNNNNSNWNYLTIDLIGDILENGERENKILNKWLKKIFEFYADYELKDLKIEKSKINAEYLIKNEIEIFEMVYE